MQKNVPENNNPLTSYGCLKFGEKLKNEKFPYKKTSKKSILSHF